REISSLIALLEAFAAKSTPNMPTPPLFSLKRLGEKNFIRFFECRKSLAKRHEEGTLSVVSPLSKHPRNDKAAALTAYISGNREVVALNKKGAKERT
ncbi:MAG: hypothetical protein K2M95_05330, partial [Clostridiales bacterium]|nr:hypothetical protein [Clostridiales bacterium]